jgi:hypothetical protein
MKLYLPPGEPGFACADCHDVVVPHAPHRPLLWRGHSVRQQTLSWHEPAELQVRRSA